MRKEGIAEGKLPGRYFFPGITQRMIQRAMQPACKVPRLRLRNPHDLRHTYATQLLMIGGVRIRVGKLRVACDGSQGQPTDEEPDHHRQLPGVEDDFGLSQVPGDFLGEVSGHFACLSAWLPRLWLRQHGPEGGFLRVAILPEYPVEVGVFHRLEVRDLNGDEPARQRQVHVPGLISLRGVDGGEDELEVGREPHDVPGPNEFMELRLNEGVRPVEFIEEGGFGLPDREGGRERTRGRLSPVLSG